MDFGNISTNIIKKGLVFNMDAANRASYPKTGTTATDTINSLAGTFSSSPTFDSSEGQGVIDFDSTDNINFGDNDILDWGSGDGTIGAWCKCASGNGVQDFVMKGAYSTNGKSYTLLLSTSEKLMFASHAEVSGKMEMPEEEILWKFVSSRSFRKGKGASLDRYRGFDCTDENTRYKQYEKAVKHNTMKEWKKAVQAI